MAYETKVLQDKIIAELLVANVTAVPLNTKDDLNMTGVAPTVHIQYAGAKHIDKTRNFGALFNIYIVHKTLSATEKETIYGIMDSVRFSLSSMQIDYEKFVTKQYPATIEQETITEAKGSTFVYMFTVNFKVRI